MRAGKVYIVDDHEATRDSLALLFGTLGWEVTTFAGAAACLIALNSSTDLPNCIITDLNMPGMSGVELMLAFPEAMKNIPVVVMTAEDRASAAIQLALLAGARQIVHKPFQMEVIRNAVELSLAPIRSE
ncbi:MAG TPA: response regulator [Nevskiaceae bacterium]|nr:response regulator [Nevskiaceae bacterium]